MNRWLSRTKGDGSCPDYNGGSQNVVKGFRLHNWAGFQRM